MVDRFSFTKEDIIAGYYYVIREVYSSGKLEMIKWLVGPESGFNFTLEDINSNDYHAFRKACLNWSIRLEGAEGTNIRQFGQFGSQATMTP